VSAAAERPAPSTADPDGDENQREYRRAREHTGDRPSFPCHRTDPAISISAQID
jgi:hypothetical protein